MPTPVDRSNAVAAPPETDAQLPDAAPPARSSDADHVAQFASPAADAAVSDIEASYGSGWVPEMEKVESDFSKLGGFDLLHATDRLERDQKLDPIINRMTPD